MHLVLLDLSGIQSFIFGSNRMRLQASGSSIVAKALSTWLAEAGVAAGLTPGWDQAPPDACLGASPDAAACVTRCGGNATLLVRDETVARNLVSELHARILERAEGLELAAAIVAADRSRPPDLVFAAAHAELWQVKESRRGAFSPMVPPGMERCAVTGGAAARWARMDSKIWPLGRSAIQREAELPIRGATSRVELLLAARASAASARAAEIRNAALGDDGASVCGNALGQALRNVRDAQLVFSDELESLRGARGETSYLGVIHTDLNRAGAAFRSVTHGVDWRLALQRLHFLSARLDVAATNAVAACIDALVQGARPDSDDPRRRRLFGKIPLHDDVLPLRPIVMGGDDLTIVVEGRIALHVAELLATTLDRELEDLARALSRLGPENDQPIPDVVGLCSATGVALGRAHTPFWQLYRLADARCAWVKRESQRKRTSIGWLFHEDATAEGQRAWPRGDELSGQPYTVEPGDIRSMQHLRDRHLKPLQELGGDAHSQLKAFAGRLTSGADINVATELQALKLRGHGRLTEALRGMVAGASIQHAPIVDALELLDFAVVPE